MARKVFPTIMTSMTEETKAIIAAVQAVPPGKTTSYGAVARSAGLRGGFRPPNPRQVARILHSCSERYGLPWYRIVNAKGRLSLPPGGGFEEQAARLQAEGVTVSADGAVDPGCFLAKLP